MRAKNKVPSVLSNSCGVSQGAVLSFFSKNRWLPFLNMQMAQSSATPIEIFMVFPSLMMPSGTF